MIRDTDEIKPMACCPDCRSGRAVPKWEAWDALCEVPPKTKAELERLRAIEQAAIRVDQGRHHGDSDTVVVTIKASALEALREALEDAA